MSTVALNSYKPPYFQAFLSNEIADLARIYDPDTNICIVERQINESVKGFVGHLLKRPTSVSFVEIIDFASFNFFNLLPDAGHLPGYRDFCKDVACLAGLYCDLILDPDAIQTIPSYAIGLFKGSRWEGNELHGAMHRSPQVTSPRLLLTLDFG